MDTEHLKDTTLVRSLGEVVADVSDLLQKEIRLAKAEFSAKLSRKLEASVWMVVAGLLGLVVLMLVVEAAVFGIASTGIELHWACLIVAAVLALGALAAWARWRAGMSEDFGLDRTLTQIRKDIATTKEQLT